MAEGSFSVSACGTWDHSLDPFTDGHALDQDRKNHHQIRQGNHHIAGRPR